MPGTMGISVTAGIRKIHCWVVPPQLIPFWMIRPTPTDATIGGTGPRPSSRAKIKTSRRIPTTASARKETIAPQIRESARFMLTNKAT